MVPSNKLRSSSCKAPENRCSSSRRLRTAGRFKCQTSIPTRCPFPKRRSRAWGQWLARLLPPSWIFTRATVAAKCTSTNSTRMGSLKGCPRANRWTSKSSWPAISKAKTVRKRSLGRMTQTSRTTTFTIAARHPSSCSRNRTTPGTCPRASFLSSTTTTLGASPAPMSRFCKKKLQRSSLRTPPPKRWH